MTERPSDFDDVNSPQSADWEALARHMSEEDTTDSRTRADELLSDPATRELFQSLSEISGQMSRDAAPAGLDVEGALSRVKARIAESDAPLLRIEQPARKTISAPATAWRVPFPAIAAAALIAIGLGTWFTASKRSSTDSAVISTPRMIATGVGSRDSMRLSDGTKVIIGPQSSVKVASGYDVSSREVEVRGDAYFEVVHNAARPFTVKTESAVIQDVGTKFAVRTDAADGVGVTVTEGSVSLAPAQAASPPVVLKAGDRGSLNSSGKVVTRRGASADDDMAWLSGRLVFRETPISEVVSSLRRWYGIDLQLADSSLANRHLTATFSGEPANRVLEVLSLALGTDIERHGDTAIVRSVKGRVR